MQEKSKKESYRGQNRSQIPEGAQDREPGHSSGQLSFSHKGFCSLEGTPAQR